MARKIVLAIFAMVAMMQLLVAPGAYAFGEDDEFDDEDDEFDDEPVTIKKGDPVTTGMGGGDIFSDEDLDEDDEDDEEATVETETEDFEEALAEQMALVKTNYRIVGTTDLAMAIGREVIVLCSFQNEADHGFNVSHIQGSLSRDDEYSTHIWNYSETVIGEWVNPNEEFTFDYRFTPHPQLDAIKYRVAIEIFYEDKDTNDMYRKTFFNETIDMYMDGNNDAAFLPFTYLLVLVLIVSGGMYLFSSVTGTKIGSVESIVDKMKPVETAEEGDGWDEHIAQVTAVKKRTVRKSKR